MLVILTSHSSYLPSECHQHRCQFYMARILFANGGSQIPNANIIAHIVRFPFTGTGSEGPKVVFFFFFFFNLLDIAALLPV